MKTVAMLPPEDMLPVAEPPIAAEAVTVVVLLVCLWRARLYRLW